MTTARQTLDIRQLRIAPLSEGEALRGFHCGEREIDRNIGKCCGWHFRHRSKIFCAHVGNDPRVYGFYCIGISASDAKYLNEEITRANDGRAFIPFIYLNYLAVQEECQGQKIGTLLLGNMLSRCGQLIRNVGVYGVALNALNDRVIALYQKYGFRQYAESKFPLMILPAQSVLDLTAGEPNRIP